MKYYNFISDNSVTFHASSLAIILSRLLIICLKLYLVEKIEPFVLFVYFVRRRISLCEIFLDLLM